MLCFAMVMLMMHYSMLHVMTHYIYVIHSPSSIRAEPRPKRAQVSQTLPRAFAPTYVGRIMAHSMHDDD